METKNIEFEETPDYNVIILNVIGKMRPSILAFIKNG